MGNVNRLTKTGKDTTIVSALQQNLLGFDSLPLGGKIYTQAEAAAFIASRAVAALAVEQARAAWLDAIAAFEKLDAEADIVVRDLRNVVIGACGAQSPIVGTFGFRPRKKPELTPAQKTAANLKRAATRKKRNTMGRKQRLKVKGEVPAAPAEPEPTAAGTAVALAVAGAMAPEATTTAMGTTAGVGAEGGAAVAAGEAGAGSTDTGRGGGAAG